MRRVNCSPRNQSTWNIYTLELYWGHPNVLPLLALLRKVLPRIEHLGLVLDIDNSNLAVRREYELDSYYVLSDESNGKADHGAANKTSQRTKKRQARFMDGAFDKKDRLDEDEAHEFLVKELRDTSAWSPAPNFEHVGIRIVVQSQADIAISALDRIISLLTPRISLVFCIDLRQLMSRDADDPLFDLVKMDACLADPLDSWRRTYIFVMLEIRWPTWKHFGPWTCLMKPSFLCERLYHLRGFGLPLGGIWASVRFLQPSSVQGPWR
ncbi:hypothetical protein OBBRIDRAFT_797725 [Obba rivulosa]|uniref:Uncharacterized protein n=1 Tax=Obba rivulosa TaxID=1052685 RepID=A0A8E2DKK2_9APHY|nr:hypothetical protein OBBRIDRAFT_797725 [Obba rivulosa]